MQAAAGEPSGGRVQQRLSARAAAVAWLAGAHIVVFTVSLCLAPGLFAPLCLFGLVAFALSTGALWRALAPLQMIATSLQTTVVATGAQGPADGEVASLAHMRANVEAIAARLETWRRRPRRHPLTGLALQDAFLTAANEDIDAKCERTLMGLVRVANYEAMAGFDPQAGERALNQFAKRLIEALDPQRLVAHIDRDCFAIWFRGAGGHIEAAAELQALNYVLAQGIDAGSFTVTPDVQIGSALYPVDSADAANLLSRAFVSLARPQRGLSGALQFFSGAGSEETKRRFALEQQLRRAIEERQLELYYQPIVDIETRAIIAAEALLRWRHPTLGLVSPAEFIPILEATGLIEDIGLWTINTVCRHLRRWREQGLELRIAVNLSARQLSDPGLAKTIARTLAAHNLAPADLELELTETAAMEDAAGTLALFHELRREGFGLSLDDFGIGYSSFGYLRTLPFTKLKIDREFVTEVDRRAGSRAICKALIELAHGLNINVLAEGVERMEEVDTLRRLGCTQFQGFYFAKPMPAKELLSAVAAGAWQDLVKSPVHRRQAELGRRIGE